MPISWLFCSARISLSTLPNVSTSDLPVKQKALCSGFPYVGDKIDFLHVDSRKAYDYHRKGGQDVPQDFEMKVNWERDWVAKAMGGEMN